MKSICVYCGAAAGNKPEFLQAARAFGELVAKRGMKLVYGGGHVGLMGVVADAALNAGGYVEGVIPQSMADKELAHTGIQKLHVVESMHDRKKLMAELSDAFVALPGGIGTLDELFEIWTWRQIRLHDKPIGLLNVNGYWDKLLELADNMDAHDFLHRNARAMIVSDSDPVRLLELLGA
ncbi:MAG: TIGR00730 family Rossman fold protein [Planctomycetes bacterium]|nr:TIGR00730 family Rossman fold protein [Planctomycetota bacterium]